MSHSLPNPEAASCRHTSALVRTPQNPKSRSGPGHPKIPGHALAQDTPKSQFTLWPRTSPNTRSPQNPRSCSGPGHPKIPGHTLAQGGNPELTVGCLQRAGVTWEMAEGIPDLSALYWGTPLALPFAQHVTSSRKPSMFPPQ